MCDVMEARVLADEALTDDVVDMHAPDDAARADVVRVFVRGLPCGASDNAGGAGSRASAALWRHAGVHECRDGHGCAFFQTLQ